jgi:hypothetical protein
MNLRRQDHVEKVNDHFLRRHFDLACLGFNLLLRVPGVITEETTVAEAAKDFKVVAPSPQDKYKKLYLAGGNDENRYAISYWMQAQADPEGGSFYANSYSSSFCFQKGTLLIEIVERSTNKTSKRKDEIIKAIAKELNK